MSSFSDSTQTYVCRIYNSFFKLFQICSIRFHFRQKSLASLVIRTSRAAASSTMEMLELVLLTDVHKIWISLLFQLTIELRPKSIASSPHNSILYRSLQTSTIIFCITMKNFDIVAIISLLQRRHAWRIISHRDIKTPNALYMSSRHLSCAVSNILCFH